MQLDKDTIINMLKDQGKHAEAGQAQAELPDQVDTDQHSGLLDKFGVNPQELISKFSGGDNPLGDVLKKFK